MVQKLLTRKKNSSQIRRVGIREKAQIKVKLFIHFGIYIYSSKAGRVYARLELMNKSLTVVIPVFNEEKDLPKNLPKLIDFLDKKMSAYQWEIIIADSASTDKTSEIAQKFAQSGRIKYLRLEQKGRGRALKKAWKSSESELLAYMDVDLSSDLEYFPKLINALEAGADIAVGSRLKKGARVFGRPLVREVMSRGYSLLFRSLFWTSFSDAQCGFKAITRETARKLLPVIEDNNWFFDSELLIIAQKAGFRITEIPIVWKDDPTSTVKVAKTAWGDIKGLVRLLFTRPWKKIH